MQPHLIVILLILLFSCTYCTDQTKQTSTSKSQIEPFDTISRYDPSQGNLDINYLNNKSADKEFLELSGPVKSLFAISYEAIDSSGITIRGVRHPKYRAYFNKTGGIINRQSFFPPDYQSSANSYGQYNDDGHLIETSYESTNDKISSKKIFKRNKGGKIIEVLKYVGDGFDGWYYKDSIIYNKKGQPVEVRKHYENNVAVFTVNKYIYNRDGKLIEEIQFDNIGRMKSKETYSYSDSGYIKIIYNYHEGEFLNNEKLIFDSEGKIMEHVYHTINSLSHKFVTIYDDRDKIIEEHCEDFENPNASYKILYKYNNEGNLIKTITQNNDGSSSSREFIYDQENNWINAIDMVNGNIKAFHERKIEYYEN